MTDERASREPKKNIYISPHLERIDSAKGEQNGRNVCCKNGAKSRESATPGTIGKDGSISDAIVRLGADSKNWHVTLMLERMS